MTHQISHLNLEQIVLVPLGLTAAASTAIQDDAKEQRRGFLSMLLVTLGASLLGDMLFGKKGKGTVTAGEGTIRAGYGSKGSLIKRSLLKKI